MNKHLETLKELLNQGHFAGLPRSKYYLALDYAVTELEKKDIAEKLCGNKDCPTCKSWLKEPERKECGRLYENCPNCKDPNLTIPKMPDGGCGVCGGKGIIEWKPVGKIVDHPTRPKIERLQLSELEVKVLNYGTTKMFNKLAEIIDRLNEIG